jgi:hypothetical protein
MTKPVPPAGIRFQPGKSGNPGGRPKAVKEVVELCRDLTSIGLKRMKTILESDTAPPAAQVAAFNAVMDRGWGKVTQAVELSGPDGGPVQSITLTTDDPIEAAKQYQRLMGG